MTIFVASTSAGKLREFQQSAQGFGIQAEPLPGMALLPEPAEDAGTFMGNAEIKALAYSLAVQAAGRPGMLVLADDSGLEVDALHGKPGVRSARFADDLGFEPDSPAVRNARNMHALLGLMKNVPVGRRRGYFRCALVLARDGVVLERAEGAVEGEILTEPHGVGGFGYDPVFFVPRLGLTLAGMAPAVKWSVSHRGEAFREMLQRPLLRRDLGSS